MAFTSEGTFNVIITKAIIGEPKFAKDYAGAFDVCIEVQDVNGNIDVWRGEWSNRPGIGNASDKTQCEMTLETLIKIGLPNADLFAHLQADENGIATIPILVGKQTTATTKSSEKDGKVYYNVRYLGGGSDVNGISFNALMQAYGKPVQSTQPVANQMPVGQGLPQQAPPFPNNGNPFGNARG